MKTIEIKRHLPEGTTMDDVKEMKDTEIEDKKYAENILSYQTIENVLEMTKEDERLTTGLCWLFRELYLGCRQLEQADVASKIEIDETVKTIFIGMISCGTGDAYLLPDMKKKVEEVGTWIDYAHDFIVNFYSDAQYRCNFWYTLWRVMLLDNRDYAEKIIKENGIGLSLTMAKDDKNLLEGIGAMYMLLWIHNSDIYDPLNLPKVEGVANGIICRIFIGLTNIFNGEAYLTAEDKKVIGSSDWIEYAREELENFYNDPKYRYDLARKIYNFMELGIE